MYNLLIEKLGAYIYQNNPDLLHSLNTEFKWSTYLEDKVSKAMPMVLRLLGEGKPGHAIEELVLNELTADLRPSKFNYIKSVLQEDFPALYKRLYQDGVLAFETIKLVETGKDIFEAFSFSAETENDSHLRHAIIAHIHQNLS